MWGPHFVEARGPGPPRPTSKSNPLISMFLYKITIHFTSNLKIVILIIKFT